MSKKILGFITGAVFFFLGSVTPSFAVTYNYLGSVYTTFNTPPLTPVLGTFMTGSLTFSTAPSDGIYQINDPLITNVSLTSGTLSLSDKSILVGTPESNFVGIVGGQITSWSIFMNRIDGIIFTPDERHIGFLLGIGRPEYSGGDVAAQIDYFAPSNAGFSHVPGVWTEVVPLPAALPLFAAGLGAMGLMARRKKRKAAVAG